MKNIRNLLLFFLSTTIVESSCSERLSEISQTPSRTITDSVIRGGKMYQSFCLTCHGYNNGGSYYQPALDSMYSLFKAKKFNFSFVESHSVLLKDKDSIDIQSITLYMEDKYDHILQKK